MNREVHVRICEGRGVRFPPATRRLVSRHAVLRSTRGTTITTVGPTPTNLRRRPPSEGCPAAVRGAPPPEASGGGRRLFHEDTADAEMSAAAGGGEGGARCRTSSTYGSRSSSTSPSPPRCWPSPS